MINELVDFFGSYLLPNSASMFYFEVEDGKHMVTWFWMKSYEPAYDFHSGSPLEQYENMKWL